MAGRRPKPTELKLITGNPGKRKLSESEPIAPGNIEDPPEWMTDGQKEGWKYAIEDAPLGLLRKADRSILSIWVVAEDMHRQAAQKVAQFGMLTELPNAKLSMQSPYLSIVNAQVAIMQRAASELGFSLGARSRDGILAADDRHRGKDKYFRKEGLNVSPF
jgi:P27 family predicted phage terminase small subunit